MVLHRMTVGLGWTASETDFFEPNSLMYGCRIQRVVGGGGWGPPGGPAINRGPGHFRCPRPKLPQRLEHKIIHQKCKSDPLIMILTPLETPDPALLTELLGSNFYQDAHVAPRPFRRGNCKIFKVRFRAQGRETSEPSINCPCCCTLHMPMSDGIMAQNTDA